MHGFRIRLPTTKSKSTSLKKYGQVPNSEMLMASTGLGWEWGKSALSRALAETEVCKM